MSDEDYEKKRTRLKKDIDKKVDDLFFYQKVVYFLLFNEEISMEYIFIDIFLKCGIINVEACLYAIFWKGDD